MADFKDIIQHNEDELNSEELLRYLDTNATEKEKHAIEKKFSDSSFESDAVEGLQQIKKEKLQSHVNLIHKRLAKQLLIKKERKKFKELHWSLFAIIIILLLCILAYAVFRML